MNTRTRCEQLAGEGKTQKEIAAIVGVSWSAVRCHLNEDRRHSQNEKIAEHRKRIKRKAVDYSGGKCVKCGYDLCVAAMDFHHLDPNAKEVRISSGCTRSWCTIKGEVDKCVLVCCRCHVEVHNGIIQITDDDTKRQQWLRGQYADVPLWRYGSDREEVERKIKTGWGKTEPHPCPGCGIITGRETYCSHKCAMEDREKIMWPANLPELVKQSSQRQIAIQLGVSDHSVAKRLKNHHGGMTPA